MRTAEHNLFKEDGYTFSYQGKQMTVKCVELEDIEFNFRDKLPIVQSGIVRVIDLDHFKIKELWVNWRQKLAYVKLERQCRPPAPFMSLGKRSTAFISKYFCRVPLEYKPMPKMSIAVLVEKLIEEPDSSAILFVDILKRGTDSELKMFKEAQEIVNLFNKSQVIKIRSLLK